MARVAERRCVITPLGDRIVVDPSSPEQMTPSGIVIPDSAQGRPDRGRVVSVGEKVENVMVGDEVLFTLYAGTDVEVGDQTLKVLKMDDVLAIVRP